MSYVQTREAILAKWREGEQPGLVRVEDKANGPAIIDDLRSAIPGIVPVSVAAKSKQARAFAVSPMVEAGNVYLPDSAPWVDAYLHELTTFPRGRHDDRVDETTQVLARVIRTSHTLPEQPHSPQRAQAARQFARGHPFSPTRF